MSDMLRQFDKICRRNNLKYWCCGGTLIGAVRHKGWIPYDADVDVSMLEDDYKKLQCIIQQELPKYYWFQDKSTDKYYNIVSLGKIRYLYAIYKDYYLQTSHNGLQLDIFIYKDNGSILQAPYEGNDGNDIKSIPRETIFPLKQLYFSNILVLV